VTAQVTAQDRKASTTQIRSRRTRAISDYRKSRGCARGRAGGDRTAAREINSKSTLQLTGILYWGVCVQEE